MRLTIKSLTLGLSLVGVLGCGDDSSSSPDAAKAIDARGIDAPEPAMFKNFNADEGGEVRLEWVNFVNGNAAIRTTNFIYKTAGTPAFYPFVSVSGCTDADKAKGVWPTSQNDGRVYMDPGLVLVSGGPTTFTMRRNAANGFDSLGRNHPAGKFWFSFGGATANDAATYITEKTAFDVTFTGSAEIPAQTFKEALWMPSNYSLTTPPFAPYALAGGVDQTFTWTTPTQDGLPADRRVDSLVGFTGPNGVSAVCIEPNDGSITVTAAMADIVRAKYPTGGVMARQTLTHVPRELMDNNGPTGRRIDFITIWCNANPFTVP